MARLTGVFVLCGVLIVGLVGSLACAVPAWAAPSLLRESEVRAYLDGVIPKQLTELKIPGAAVSVVGNGRQVLARGYGLADIEGGRPFDQQTTFHIDSVSKLITATAVMQLVEQGRLDLDADVNQYLATFKIRDTYPGRPVTLAHLLTHTAGFEDALIGGSGADPDQPRDLGTYLAENQAPRVRPPGMIHSYSDYGFELAGYLVEQCSGVPFERYVHDHVFVPLGMTHTSFATSSAQDAEGKERAVGYTVVDGQVTKAERGYDNLAPSVGVVSTMYDMSRFMLAHLGGGAVGGSRVLQRSTVDLMQRRRFGENPRLPGLGLPFAEARHGGQHLLGHSGEGAGSHSMLTLLPDLGVGLFVTYNGNGTHDNPLFDASYTARQRLRDGFVEHFAAGRPDKEQPGVHMDVAQYTGNYRWTKFGAADPGRLFALLSVPADLRVTANDQGELITTGFSTDPAGAAQRWVAAGPDLFRERHGSNELGFTRDGEGRIASVTTTYDYYHFTLEPTPWYDTLLPHLASAGAGLLLMLTILAWPVAALVRRLRGTRPRGSRGSGAARAIVGATVVLALGCVLAAGHAAMTGRPVAGAWSVLPILVALGLALSTLATVVSWRRRWWTTRHRIHLSLVTVAMMVFLTVAHHYDLVLLPSGLVGS